MSAGSTAAALSGPMSGIAARYAGAFFELAQEAGALDAAEADLKALKGAIAASADLRGFLASPVYDAADQARAIGAIGEKLGLGPLTRNFLGLVARNRRLFALEAVIAAFLARLSEHRGEVRAEALSAAPLSDDHLKRLRGEIEAMVGRAVLLDARVDPDLLGGLVVKVGSTMIDSSLKTKLNRMKSVMKEAR